MKWWPGEGQISKLFSQDLCISGQSLTLVDKSLALVGKSLTLVHSKLFYHLLISNFTTFVFKSEVYCGLLKLIRVNQELREDPELDNDGYSL